MRIVIDLQAAQAENQKRGIGRYSLSLALAMARNRGAHEIIIALNGLFPDTIEPIRASFDGLLPQENIRVWSVVPPVASISSDNDWRRQSAELVREAFLASLNPDVVHLSSLFEGFVDDAVTSIGALSPNIPTAVTLYDLIPYINPKTYLVNPVLEEWYLGKILQLRRADLWLSISESSRREGVEYLNLPEDRCVNISADADAYFQPLEISTVTAQVLRQKYGLQRPFVMYTGGMDYRKNLDGLIRAFAKLPKSLRETHQLAIVCSVQPEGRRMLEQLAEQQGLAGDELVITGFVPDSDLLALYNLCSLFVFPSWHEGFGLPALEAMRCGAPVIGANTSSLPEVIGWADALFDPYSDKAMAQSIERVLSDPEFRAELVRNGRVQSKRFSWDESARRAIASMECLVAEKQTSSEVQHIDGLLPRLAYISPLPPDKSGIADYSAILLPELARWYEIEVIVPEATVTDPWIKENCEVRTTQWFIEHANCCERVLYHFGNSTFHQHMFGLLKEIPGVVVLHDFFLSGIAVHMEAQGFAPGYWRQELYMAHGYKALKESFDAKDMRDVVWKYPCSQSVVHDSLGVIVHSPNSLKLAEQWYGGESEDWMVIPLVRDVGVSVDKEQARKALGFGSEDFLVCAFGILGPTKLNHRLLNAWLRSSLAHDKTCHLVFVGQNCDGGYGEELLAGIHNSRGRENIRITGWVDKDVYCQYLAAADVGVQLRTLSRGETSAAVLDCMTYGLATIVNSNGSMADFDQEAVWKLPDNFFDEQLVEAIKVLWQDESRRKSMGQSARNVILRDHNPQSCTKKYVEAIEKFYRLAGSGFPALPSAIAAIHNSSVRDADLIQLADAIAISIPQRNRQNQLFVDISELVQRDARSGIQRVVRSILNEWLLNPPEGYRVEPVYASMNQGYQYARRFTLNFLGCPDGVLHDEPIDYASGDVFFALDLQPHIVSANRNFYQSLRRQGVRVHFAVYDLLCTSMPQYFPPGAEAEFGRWLEVVAESDGAICISKAVADELEVWVKKNGSARFRPFTIEWFNLGADVSKSVPTKGLPADARDVLARLRCSTSFLMVGTLEPRKGHAQVLEAFEHMWRAGRDINLVIVGKHGWMVEKLVERLRSHPEMNGRLFWLESVSDEYLEKIYDASTCLVAASEGEGFGLPVIEAAQHNLPIIVREIPVFREIAGEHAFYFSGLESARLASAIDDWLSLKIQDNHPKSSAIQWHTWKQSSAILAHKLGVI